MTWVDRFTAIQPPDFLPESPVRIPRLDVPDFFLDSYQADVIGFPEFWVGTLSKGDRVYIDSWAARCEKQVAHCLAGMPVEATYDLHSHEIPALVISRFTI